MSEPPRLLRRPMSRRRCRGRDKWSTDISAHRARRWAIAAVAKTLSGDTFLVSVVFDDAVGVSGLHEAQRSRRAVVFRHSAHTGRLAMGYDFTPFSRMVDEMPRVLMRELGMSARMRDARRPSLMPVAQRHDAEAPMPRLWTGKSSNTADASLTHGRRAPECRAEARRFAGLYFARDSRVDSVRSRPIYIMMAIQAGTMAILLGCAQRRRIYDCHWAQRA